MSFVPISRVAEEMNCTERHVRRLINTGRLHAIEANQNGQKMRLVEWSGGHVEAKKPAQESNPLANQVPHKSYAMEWREMASQGYLNKQNRPVTERTLEDYAYVLKSAYFKRESLISYQGLYNVFTQYQARQYHYKKQIYWAVVSYAKFLVMKEVLPESELNQIKTLKPTKCHAERRTVLTEDQVKQGLEVIVGNFKHHPYRKALNNAIFSTLVQAGLRNEELCNLELANIDWENRSMRFRGKGNKWRSIGITTELYQALQEYRQVRPKTDLPYFFINELGNKFTRTSIANKVKRIGKHLQTDITPHGLRRTFATVNARKGRSIDTISKGLGHTNLRITQLYLMTQTEHVIEDMKNW